MLKVRDIMTVAPVTLDPKDTLRFAAGVLTSIGASGAPVMTGDRVVGVLSMTDIMDFAAHSPSLPGSSPPSHARRQEAVADDGATMAVPEGPEWDALDEHTVEEVMSLRVLALPPDAEVKDLARLMEGEGVHRIVVMDGRELVGVATASDLVRAVARGDLA